MFDPTPSPRTTTSEFESPCNERLGQHSSERSLDHVTAADIPMFEEVNGANLEASEDDADDDDEDMLPTAEVPYPGFEQTVFRCLPQTHKLRLMCLYLITSPYPF